MGLTEASISSVKNRNKINKNEAISKN